MNKKRYAIFVLEFDHVAGHNEVKLLGYITKERKPKDDTFDFNYQKLFVLVGTERYYELLAQVTINIPAIIKELKNGQKTKTECRPVIFEQLTLF